MGKSILLLGGGGHCLSVIDSLLKEDKYERIGIVDCIVSDKKYPNKIEYVGNDDDLPRLFKEGWSEAFVTVGSIDDTTLRRKLFEKINQIGFKIPSIIDKSAIVANSANISSGVYIGKGVIVNSYSNIGKCSIINSGAIIEHECNIGAFANICPRVTLCGGVSVADDSFVGAGATIIQQIVVGKAAIIGAGSVVLSDIPEETKAYGNPCRIIKKV